MRISVLSWIRKALGMSRQAKSRSQMLASTGGDPLLESKLKAYGLVLCEDVSDAMWVEESLSDFGSLRSLLPAGFEAYARVFHPAYLGDSEDQPVRWSTVASWTGRTVHPLMQFERIAGLSEDCSYPDPLWGSHPVFGSIPEPECRTLVDVLKDFTSTPGNCFFGLWDGYSHITIGGGNSHIENWQYHTNSRLRAPGRDYVLFRGPLDSIMAFLVEDEPFWGNSPNIWWPEDRAWCVATDIDLFDTFVGGSEECVEAVLSNPDLEVLRTTLDAILHIGGDTINPPNRSRDRRHP